MDRCGNFTERASEYLTQFLVKNCTGTGLANSICKDLREAVCPTKEDDKRPTSLEVWGYGGLFVLLVSLSSVVGVFFLPLMKKDFYKKVLMGMVGLGVGCLCGSAILHLIPQAFQMDAESGEAIEAYLFHALVVIAAIYVFFLTERLLKLSVDHRKRVNRHKKSQFASGLTKASSPGHDVVLTSDFDRHHHHDKHGNGNGEVARLSDDSFEDHHAQRCHDVHIRIPPAEVKTHAHEHELDAKDVKEHPIKTVAWMVITGDGIHNFVDGLAMGAAFSGSIEKGITISIAVLCEELPHELGDLAILLNSGMSLKKALVYNFLSACTCFLGLIVGILLGELEETTPWIFAIAGGMFLYISLVDMLPEMTHAAEEASGESFKEGLVMLIIQNAGMLSGFMIMFLLARYSNAIKLS